MPLSDRERLREIKTFPSLVKYLQDELDWPIEAHDFDDLTFDYEPEELGIDAKAAAKVEEIKQLRPLVTYQPWGIFFIKFEPKRLPVMALRRILSQLVMKKRVSARKAEQKLWGLHDLLFISNYGEGDQRQITFAHFAQEEGTGDLPTLRVLGWDDADTALHIDHVHEELKDKLRWPEDGETVDQWRTRWSSVFTLRHREVITTSKDMSQRLAQLATEIRKRVNTILRLESERGPLRKLQVAFKETLIHDLSDDDFADMYAQTITYGLLTARVSRPAGIVAENVADMVPVTNPFLRDMLSTFLTIGGRKGKIDFDEVGINDVVQTLRKANMEAVLRDFGDRKPDEDPVIFFYEDFLKAYDPEKKVRRGIFYTPRPVVSYIVRSVHELLQREFGLEDGLADTTTWGEMVKKHNGLVIPKDTNPTDPFVQILDPAAGTGTFLVEVIDVIHRTLTTKWKLQGLTEAQQRIAWNDYVPKHLLTRLHGYELMMAPYAIAHMKIGLKLYETGYRFDSDERARIYLTNSLEPPSDIQPGLEGLSPALAHEAQAVNTIKRHQRFTVVLGNPPYSGLSANMSEFAGRLIEPYKYVSGVHFGERKHWLHDDYVKFVRISETIINAAKVGLIGLITNHAFYDNPTFRGMRWNLLQSFQHIRILDLHGNTMKRERNPFGGEDKNVFDIQQGVAITLFSKLPQSQERLVTHGELWGPRKGKYAILQLQAVDELSKAILNPKPQFYFFVPRTEDNGSQYQSWLRLNEVFAVFSTGFITARDHFVLDFDRESLIARISAFADPKLTDDEIRARYFAGCGSPKYPDGDTRGWKVPEARNKVRDDDHWRHRVRRCLYRPFDSRWIYWTEWMVDWPRPEVSEHLLIDGNLALVFMRQVASGDDYSHFIVSRLPVDNRACYSNKGIMTLAPLYLHAPAVRDHEEFTFGEKGVRPNFTSQFTSELRRAIGESAADGRISSSDIFQYAYAVFHSPSYRSRYTESLKTDFPRLPLTGNLELFRALAQLGGELVALHLMESPKLDKHITKWLGKTPSGEVEKATYSDKTVWIDKAKTEGFRGVPENVWNFHIGGYQVCEKWLKDRKGRVLNEDDIKHYHRIVVALNETIRLMAEIDKVIDKHGGWPGAFVTSQPAAT